MYFLSVWHLCIKCTEIFLQRFFLLFSAQWTPCLYLQCTLQRHCKGTASWSVHCIWLWVLIWCLLYKSKLYFTKSIDTKLAAIYLAHQGLCIHVKIWYGNFRATFKMSHISVISKKFHLHKKQKQMNKQINIPLRARSGLISWIISTSEMLQFPIYM